MTAKSLQRDSYSRPGAWVQTDRATHEEWARLSVKSPRASSLLHMLAARVGDQNAVVVSHGTLAKLLNCSRRTVIRAIEDLVAGNWIEVWQIGQNGTSNAYVLNDRVAWHGSREGLRWSLFRANVLVNAEEQATDPDAQPREPLRQMPRMLPGERQLPSGPGLPPPSEGFLPGLEPELPAVELAPADDVAGLMGDFTRGLRIDPETGEIGE